MRVKNSDVDDILQRGFTAGQKHEQAKAAHARRMHDVDRIVRSPQPEEPQHRPKSTRELALNDLAGRRAKADALRAQGDYESARALHEHAMDPDDAAQAAGDMRAAAGITPPPNQLVEEIEDDEQHPDDSVVQCSVCGKKFRLRDASVIPGSCCCRAPFSIRDVTFSQRDARRLATEQERLTLRLRAHGERSLFGTKSEPVL